MPWVCRNIPAGFEVAAPQSVIDLKSKNDIGAHFPKFVLITAPTSMNFGK
jgi:hypothetical protein